MWLLLPLLLLPSRSVRAQPCGGYETEPLPPETLDRWVAVLQEADLTAADVSRGPAARLAAYGRMVAVEREIDDAYGICSLPDPADGERFRAAAGRGLDDGSVWRRAAWEGCARMVAQTHASGPEAEACVREGFRAVRPLAPEPPAAWREAGPDGGSRFYEALRADWDGEDPAVRSELAAICLASGDWAGVLELLPATGGSYEEELLRGAALAGRGDSGEAACLMRGLVRRSPRRPEAHFNLALLAAAGRAWPMRGPATLRRPFLHALAYLCLTGSEGDPALADEATELARVLEEVMTGRSAWIYPSDADPPPLPLPPEALGPSARDWPADTPHAHTCPEVLRAVAPGAPLR